MKIQSHQSHSCLTHLNHSFSLLKNSLVKMVLLGFFFLVKEMVMLGLSENLRGDTITLMTWTKGMSK